MANYYSENELVILDITELSITRDLIRDDIDSIKNQIVNNQGDDKDWEHKAKMALKYKNRELNAVNQLISKKKKAEKERNHLLLAERERDLKNKSDAELFVFAAKSILDKNLYQKIWEVARA